MHGITIRWLALTLAIIVAVVFVELGQRRIPVQFAKRVVGRRMMGGQNTYIPLKVNQSGVIPIIFAQSIIMFPATLGNFFPNNDFWISLSRIFTPPHIIYVVVYSAMIILFAYFYTAVILNPRDVADNLKKQSGFIPGRNRQGFEKCKGLIDIAPVNLGDRAAVQLI